MSLGHGLQSKAEAGADDGEDEDHGPFHMGFGPARRFREKGGQGGEEKDPENLQKTQLKGIVFFGEAGSKQYDHGVAQCRRQGEDFAASEGEVAGGVGQKAHA